MNYDSDISLMMYYFFKPTGSLEKEAFQMSILSSGFWKKRRNEKAPKSLVFNETQCL